MKHGKKTFVIIEAVLGILVILVLGFIIYKQNGHDPETIAVIIPDVDESEWSAFKYGLKMAAREYDTDVVIISKDNMETANDEIEIMNQEIIKGADAVIVKPIANRDGQQKLKQLEKSVPIMAVGDTFPEEPSGLHTIEPDHYHMGADLAQKLLRHSPLMYRKSPSFFLSLLLKWHAANRSQSSSRSDFHGNFPEAFGQDPHPYGNDQVLLYAIRTVLREMYLPRPL